MILYVASPYQGDVDGNILRARQIAVALWRAGHVVICPATNSALMERDAPEIPHEAWLRGARALLARCDGVVMGYGWPMSEDCRAERKLALYLGMPIWYWPEMPPLCRDTYPQGGETTKWELWTIG